MGDPPMFQKTRASRPWCANAMRQLKFHHVFIALMLLAFVAAFIFPSFTTPKKPQLAALFIPVSRPAGAFGNWLRTKLDPPRRVDDRPLDDVQAENEQLRIALVHLSEQLALLKKINADRAQLGPIREFCTPMQVVGGDAAGQRETLMLGGSSTSGLAVDQPVLYADGLAGRISNVGAAGATVRLITDVKFRLMGSFCRYERAENGDLRLLKITTTPPVLEGVGENRMRIENLYMKDIETAKIQVGDWVTLDDSAWTEQLRGYPVGKVVAIRPLSSNALFAEMQVEPQGNLSRLREVMVMNKTAADVSRAGTN